ncbi:hypothetical protein DMZ48_00910 [Robertkochia solimangrovi]|nr:hypothetical protein DMZ48_00910 [Robertkochia solimangrovi]
MLLFQLPNDTGPIYTETLMGRIPVEPFNTFSNLVFLFIVIFWGVRVWKNRNDQRYLSLVLPVLFIGWIGGTLFHGTRSHEIWLLMDWVPIVLLCFSAVVYLIFRLWENWSMRIMVTLLILGTSLIVRNLPFPHQVSITIGYIVTAITLLVPLLIYLFRTGYRNVGDVVLAFTFFSVAIIFRVLDRRQDFSDIGTHWLWHLFGGIAVFFIIRYLYEDRKVKLPVPY